MKCNELEFCLEIHFLLLYYCQSIFDFINLGITYKSHTVSDFSLLSHLNCSMNLLKLFLRLRPLSVKRKP